MFVTRIKLRASPAMQELRIEHLMMVADGRPDGGAPQVLQPKCTCEQQRDGPCKIGCKEQP